MHGGPSTGLLYMKVIAMGCLGGTIHMGLCTGVLYMEGIIMQY